MHFFMGLSHHYLVRQPLVLCQSFFFQPVDQKFLSSLAPACHAAELQDRQTCEQNCQYDKQENRSSDAFPAADGAAEGIYCVSEWQKGVNFCYKGRRDFNRISSGGTGQLYDHKYQHQETADLSQGNVKVIHDRGKGCCGQAGKENCFCHFRRAESINYMEK